MPLHHHKTLHFEGITFATQANTFTVVAGAYLNLMICFTQLGVIKENLHCICPLWTYVTAHWNLSCNFHKVLSVYTSHKVLYIISANTVRPQVHYNVKRAHIYAPPPHFGSGNFPRVTLNTYLLPLYHMGILTTNLPGKQSALSSHLANTAFSALKLKLTIHKSGPQRTPSSQRTKLLDKRCSSPRVHTANVSSWKCTSALENLFINYEFIYAKKGQPLFKKKVRYLA